MLSCPGIGGSLGRRCLNSTLVYTTYRFARPSVSLNAALSYRSRPHARLAQAPPYIPCGTRSITTPARRKELREPIYTIPNMLTVSRMIATPGIGYLILHNHHVAAVSLLFVAGLTDVIDGWIARKYNMGSVVGTIIDPLADKFLMTTLVVTLSMSGQMPTWLAVIILGRDIGLGISALYWRWISLPPPRTFKRYWDFSLPSAEVHPTQISKINTGLQLALVGAYTVKPILSFDIGGLLGLEGYSYLVACTTIYSGLSYIWDKNAVKILKAPDDTEPSTKV